MTTDDAAALLLALQHPTGETVIFFREEGFYPIQLSGLKPTAVEAAEHAEMNPGTLRVEDLQGAVLWPEGARQ